MAKEFEKPILYDVDGILANWIGAVVEHSNKMHNTSWSCDQIKQDIRKYDLWTEESEELVKSPGFNRTLKELPACETVRSLLKKDYKVMFLTSPYHNATTWAHDRICWLRDHFGATRDDVIIARDKKYVDGYVFIDDLPKNVYNWSKYNNKTGILLNRPWNKEHGYDESIFVRVEEKDLLEKVLELVSLEKRNL